MSVKLNEKEIMALAKKLAMKKSKVVADGNMGIVKSKMIQAKYIMAAINAFPEPVKEFLTESRYGSAHLTVENIAKSLAKEKFNKETFEPRDLEPDVVLAAHSCKDMATLCKKLGI